MDKKSKIFFVVFGVLIAASVAVTYWRIMIKKDYIIEAQTDCDPATETCFVWECDPESEVEGEACTGDPEADVWNYMIVRRNAGYIPLCDPEDEECEALVCGENEPECEYIYCTEENKEDQGVECSVPEEESVEDLSAEESPVCESESDTCDVVAPEAVDGEIISEEVATTSVEEIATTTEEIATTTDELIN